MKPQDVLTQNLLPRWVAAHKKWLGTIPNARHVITDKSGHDVPRNEPYLVIDAIRDVMDRMHPRSEPPGNDQPNPSQRPP
jgi:hypothetical protein